MKCSAPAKFDWGRLFDFKYWNSPMEDCANDASWKLSGKKSGNFCEHHKRLIMSTGIFSKWEPIKEK